MPANPQLDVLRTALSTDPLDRGLEHEYRFERDTGYPAAYQSTTGLIPDSSGRGRHGYPNGWSSGATPFGGSSGGPGLRVSDTPYPTNTTSAVIPDANDWTVTGTEMSVEALWTPLSVAGLATIVGKSGYYGAYRLIQNGSALLFQSGGEGASNVQAGTLVAGTLYHAIATINTANNPTRVLYLNGVQIGSTANATALTNYAIALSLGADGYPLYGWLHLVRIYSRSLSDGEVAERARICLGRRNRGYTPTWLRLGKASAPAGGGGRSQVIVMG